MCTVTYVPNNNGIIISSNRDEKINRPIAVFPSELKGSNSSLFFPKDSLANGTWFIVNNNANAGVLLNGSEKPHQYSPPYKHSRGLVLIDIFKDENPLRALTQYDLQGIENFTIILFINTNLFQARWNGKKLNIQLKDSSKPHIWSSATLYNKQMIAEREVWFTEWLQNNNSENILEFHLNEKKENSEYGILMNRNNELKTVSISSVVIENHQSTMYYKDCISEKESKVTIQLKSNTAYNS